jgi:hypothetical protein
MGRREVIGRRRALALFRNTDNGKKVGQGLGASGLPAAQNAARRAFPPARAGFSPHGGEAAQLPVQSPNSTARKFCSAMVPATDWYVMAPRWQGSREGTGATSV